MRRIAADWARGAQRMHLAADFDTWAAAIPGSEDTEASVLDGQEAALVARAFARLPERWQAVLWYSAVEREGAGEVARRLGMTASGVGSLAARAREGLKAAYLEAHLDAAGSAECRHYGHLLSVAVRGGGSRGRDLERHLASCDRCGRAAADLQDINSRLGALLPVALLLWGGCYAVAPLAAGAAASGAGAPAGQAARPRAA
ncbi:hypothetical protein GCM10025734_04980 [Kitasatospora paranensis]|uniref:RNA polymerase sigma factor n=1 Tax=Kitasatospora paranensis TaxID=258053 RepID=UPI0031F02C75